MWIKLTIILLLLSIHCTRSKGDWIDLLKWNKYEKNVLQNITIGEVQYNIQDNYTFCWDKCEKNVDLSYPSSYNYPKVLWPINDALVRHWNTTKDQNTKTLIEATINKVSLDKGFLLDDGIGWLNRKGSKTFSEIIIVWNKSKTFVIVAVDFLDQPFDEPYIKLGRGLDLYSLLNDIKRIGKTVYEISSRRIIRVGCLNVEGLITKELFFFTMIPNNLNNMGGEKVIIQGPCLLKESKQNIMLTFYNNKDTEYQFKFALNILDENDGTFYFITPLTWHTGMYTFTFQYNNVTFQTEAEIYSIMDSNVKDLIHWNDSYQMNNPNFSMKYIELSVKGEYNSIELNLLSLSNVEKISIPQMKSYKMGSYDWKNFYIQDILNIDFDSSTQIGFFSMISSSATKTWSKPFSLIWLRAFVPDINKKYSFKNTECTKYLPDSSIPFNSYCSDYSKKAQLLFSKFQRLSSQLTFPIFNQENRECYANIFSSNTGVTCCYNGNGSLIYGQDYYLRNGTINSSYKWTYSPITEPIKHFFYDQLPMLSCCHLISNNILCSKYWKLNNIISSDVPHDYTGNVFGDPHFLAFNNLSKYSFLRRGEYWLIKCINDRFNLQGRFYSNENSRSLLKGIVFLANTNKVMISTKRNSATSLDWNIVYKTKLITLPFYSKGIIIKQSADTKKLLININIMDTYYAYIELTRYTYVVAFNEYMDLKVYVSNNFRDIIEGGLLGKIENELNSSSLYENNLNKTVPFNADDLEYFNFGKSWQLQYEDSLFTYDPGENFRDINLDEKFEEFPNFTEPIMKSCENIRFCSIDKTFYGENNFSEITKSTYKERIQFNQDLLNAKYGKKHTCAHPPWSSIKLDSDSYEEGSIINILGCIDPKMKMKNEKQTILCDSSLKWIPNPNIDNEFCISSKPADDVKVALIVAVPLVLVLLIIISAVLILYVKKYKKNEPTTIKSELSTSSQDPLTIRSTVSMEVVYDTWTPNIEEEEDHYGVYSHIKKMPNTKNASSNI